MQIPKKTTNISRFERQYWFLNQFITKKAPEHEISNENQRRTTIIAFYIKYDLILDNIDDFNLNI